MAFPPLRIFIISACLAAGPALAQAKEATKEAPEEVAAGAPERPATTAPAHPDCKNDVPLYEHAVQKGEHLGAIAGRYGVRRLDLVALNQLKDPDLIVPGQKVRVCPEIFPRIRKRVEYVVRKGDTLSGIAVKHGLTVEEIVARQKSLAKDPNLVRPGQSLIFFVDGGLIAEFRPPPPKKKKKKKSKKKTGGKRYAKVGKRLPEHQHIFIKRPHLAFGTTKTIRLIQSAVSSYKRRYGKGPKVHIGDISKAGGGYIRPHLSHRYGRDVDMGYVLKGKDGHRTRFSGVTRENLDLARTWALVKGFLDTQEVVYIFMDYRIQEQLYKFAKEHGTSKSELDELFQYPRGRGRSHGVIRHWRSHRNHFHVRFKR